MGMIEKHELTLSFNTSEKMWQFVKETHAIDKIVGVEDYKDWRDSLAYAVETMRKYQKIEQIITDWKSDGGAFEMSEPYWLGLISEVVEDE